MVSKIGGAVAMPIWPGIPRCSISLRAIWIEMEEISIRLWIPRVVSLLGEYPRMRETQ